MNDLFYHMFFPFLLRFTISCSAESDLHTNSWLHYTILYRFPYRVHHSASHRVTVHGHSFPMHHNRILQMKTRFNN